MPYCLKCHQDKSRQDCISYIVAFFYTFEQSKFESFHLQAGNSWEIFIYPSLEDDSPGWSRSEVCLVARGQYCATQMINRSYMHRKVVFVAENS